MTSEDVEFTELVNSLSSDPAKLIELLSEQHPSYSGRGAAALNRMRGSVLEKLASPELSDAALPFVLEELETGTDPWLLAVSARALRNFRAPQAGFARIVLDAIQRVRYRDQTVMFHSGETTLVTELLDTLAWLAAQSSAFKAEIEALRGSLPAKHRVAVDAVLRAATGSANSPRDDESCCSLGFLNWRRGARRSSTSLSTVRLQDQNGDFVAFSEFLTGHPSIVVFFYTRCDNPLKCSLSISNLGIIQRKLAEAGLDTKIRTAAITYDPGFDSPRRLRTYGGERGLRMDADHRLLRAPEDSELLREHFGLGVNFVGSVVNRHRIELFLLDGEGRVAAVFHRMRWDPAEVVKRAAELLHDNPTRTLPASLATAGAITLALLPKCPACWAAYLGMMGIAGVGSSSLSILQPLLFVFVLLNVAGVFLSSRSTGRMGPAIAVALGAVLVIVWRIGFVYPGICEMGMALTIVGSAWSVLDRRFVHSIPN